MPKNNIEEYVDPKTEAWVATIKTFHAFKNGSTVLIQYRNKAEEERVDYRPVLFEGRTYFSYYGKA